MYSDFHVHTAFSGDSETPVRKQIEKAIELSMPMICFTDHHDFDMPANTMNMNLDTQGYVAELSVLREEFADQIQILTGVELGLQEHLKEYLDSYCKAWDFDFVIGSSHAVKGIDPYFPSYYEGKEESVAYLEYFEAILANVNIHDCYDVYGHLDYVVRYGPNKNKFYNYQSYKEVIDEILRQLISRGKGIECNTGGLKYGLGHTNPHEDIIKRYHELGGEIITIGSDAHKPSDLGYDFLKIKDLLKSCGVNYYTVYQNRKPQFLLL